MARTEWPTLWRWLDDFPPITVRLAARQYGGPASRGIPHAEIAIASGMPQARVVELSYLFTWEDVTIGEARRFCTACRFDPTCRADRERQYDFLRKCLKHQPSKPPHYLRASPYWETEFLPLLLHLKTQRPRSSDDSGSSASLATRSVA